MNPSSLLFVRISLVQQAGMRLPPGWRLSGLWVLDQDGVG